MIKLSENPKHRFRIELKMDLQKNNTSNKNAKMRLSYFNADQSHNVLLQLENEIETLKKQIDELANFSKDELDTNKVISQLDSLNKKLELKTKQLSELNKFSDYEIKTQNISHSAKTIRLGSFYKIEKLWQKICITILLGSLISIIVWLLVQYTGVYTPGVSGIIQGFAKIIRLQIPDPNLASTIYNILFWGLYVVINIPLIIFSYYKIGRNFAILTGVYVIASQLVGFGLGFINNGQGLFIFTDMDKIAADTVGYVKSVQMLPWNAPNGLVFGLFVYSFIYSAINGVVYSVIYILGSSSGGTDVIGFYYSKIRNKSIGTLLTTINVISLIVGVILGSFVCWLLEIKRLNVAVNSNLIAEAFFSPNLIASILGSIISGLMYNYFFPKNKVIKVEIYSNKINEIALALKSSEWDYKIAINNDVAYAVNDNSTTNKSLETVCFYIDIPVLLSIMRSIDSQGLITIYSTFGFDGNLPSSSYGR